MAIILWDETAPAGGSKIRLGDDRIRELKEQIRLRNLQGGRIYGQATLAEEGRNAIDAGGAGVGPHIYKADGSTLLLECKTDILTELGVGWKWTGAAGAQSKNFDETVVDDDIVGVESANLTGVKRALRALRIFESDPVDTAVNVRNGIRQNPNGRLPVFYAGGNLTVGAGDLASPAAGNHAYFGIYLDSSGVLSARSGTEVVYASTPVAPNFNSDENPIAIIVVRDDSINFSIATSGDNAYLILDARADTQQVGGGVSQLGQATTGVIVEQTNILESKAITTAGGVVMVIGTVYESGAGAIRISVGRSGAPIAYAMGDASGATNGATVVGFETRSAGAHTYQLRAASAGPTASRLWVAEIGPTSFF